MATNESKYRLGLDMGTNSIGWAAVLLDDAGEPCGLLDMGVRIFPDGRQASPSGDGPSNSVQRRDARGQRRRRDRYLARRKKLMKALVKYGLMPENTAARKALEGLDPYKLRALALDEWLEPFELGRALFHLNQRRGFKSNRKMGGDEKEDGQLRAEISELRRRIEESKARTLGEYLHHRRKKGEHVRARPETGLRADRAMYEAEFDKIRAAQKQHLTQKKEKWDELRRIIFHQQDLRPVEPGWCQFEDGEYRAPKALPVFQEFRILQEVNNLRVSVDLEPERRLCEDERARAVERLRSGKDIKLSEGRDNKPAKPTRDLRLPTGAVFNLAAGGRKAIKGDETAPRLMKAKKTKTEPERTLFGNRWLGLSLDERNETVHFLLETEKPEQVKERARAEWGLSEEQAGTLANVSLPQGYGNLSEKAIRRILPHLAKGLVFSDAVVAAGYPHHSDFRNAEAHGELPYYGEVLERDAVGANPKKDPERHGEAARYGRIANPTVHIGLGQLRRVVNTLIEEYGKPEEIVVELARDLKMNREAKLNLSRQQREGRDRNNRFREDLEAAEIKVTADALRKLRLWEEQRYGAVKICPYTGRTISFEMVAGNRSSETEVDHILPFSRTLDNSMANLVVCMADANRVKGNQTPYEAFGDKCLEYVADFPANKRWRFYEDAMERYEGERDFLDRQLSETQYLSRTARTYLAWLYDEQGEHRQRVRAIPGQMTALLRRGWGLDGMLSKAEDGETPRKTRDDHRHHAVDAFVVANTTQGLLQKFADASGSHYRDAAERLAKLVPLLWEGFDRSQVQELLDNMVVSYKPDHGTRGKRGQTTGQLHEATAYGILEPVDVGDRRYKVVVRKELSNFTAKDLDKAPDTALRDALRRLWDEVGGKAAEFGKRASEEGVLVNGRRQKVRRVRIITPDERIIPIEDASGKSYKGYMPGGNEFADVWRMPDGSWRTVVVPTFDANQPGFDPNSFRPHPAAGKLMRLQIDDMGTLGEGANRRIVRVRKMDNGKSGPRIVLDDHNEANVADRIKQDAKIRRETGTDTGMKEEVFSAAKLRRLGFRPVRVDELGRVFDRGPFRA